MTFVLNVAHNKVEWSLELFKWYSDVMLYYNHTVFGQTQVCYSSVFRLNTNFQKTGNKCIIVNYN